MQHFLSIILANMQILLYLCSLIECGVYTTHSAFGKLWDYYYFFWSSRWLYRFYAPRWSPC